jgi:hypothetical protein
MNLEEVVDYFKQLEPSAKCKQQANEMQQQHEHKTPSIHKEGKPHNHNKGYRNNDGRIKDADICPIHVYLPKDKQHSWGDCYSNAKNKRKRTTFLEGQVFPEDTDKWNQRSGWQILGCHC